MPSNVYELNGSMTTIVVNNDLVFPNVQSCSAFIGVAHGGLVGAHVTVLDQTRLPEVIHEMERRIGATLEHLYVVSRGFARFEYNLCLLPGTIAANTHAYEHAGGYCDVSAQSAGGLVSIGIRSAGAGGAFTPVPLGTFV